MPLHPKIGHATARAVVRARTTTSTIVALLVLCSAAVNTVKAHDPAQHGFAMVTFDRPFAAPDFELPALDGTTRSLASWRGHYVLLNFWATWCPPCLEEMPSMQSLYKRYASQQFAVVALSSDKAGAADVQPFIDKLDVTFPVLLDVDGKIAGVYGARDLPLSFLIGPDGKVIAAAKGARDWASPQALEVIGEFLEK
ncbi:MAG: peroxiredoxin [Gammaproteobacteria bacterium]|jgi:peroxiredoxin